MLLPDGCSDSRYPARLGCLAIRNADGERRRQDADLERQAARHLAIDVDQRLDIRVEAERRAAAVIAVGLGLCLTGSCANAIAGRRRMNNDRRNLIISKIDHKIKNFDAIPYFAG